MMVVTACIILKSFAEDFCFQWVGGSINPENNSFNAISIYPHPLPLETSTHKPAPAPARVWLYNSGVPIALYYTQCNFNKYQVTVAIGTCLSGLEEQHS